MPVAAGETLTVVFPMWNEVEIIRHTVAVAHAQVAPLVRCGAIDDYEILIVDDGSTDGTGAVADELAATDEKVRVVHHDRNRKLGAAVRTGYGHATGTTVLVTGADLPFDLHELRTAFRLLRTHQADIVAAYRFHRTGEGALRWIYSHAYNSIVRALFGLQVRDVNFSAKLVRRSVLDAVELRSDGSFVDVELLVGAQQAGFRLVQFGVDSFPRWTGQSTLASPAVIATIIREMCTIGPSLGRLSPSRRP